jgi:hypothetical protein
MVDVEEVRIWKEAVMVCFNELPVIPLERLRKPGETYQDSK